MEKADSRARNYGFQASNVKGRINTIIEEFGHPESIDDNSVSADEIEFNHKEIEAKVLDQREKCKKKRVEQQDAELTWIKSSSLLSSLQDKYSQEFSQHVHKRSRVELHPIVSATFSEDECSICGTQHVTLSVKDRINSGLCPFCGSDLPHESSSDSFIKLKEIDKRVAQARSDLTAANKTKKRISDEIHAADNRLEALEKELALFEDENKKIIILSKAAKAGGVNESLTRLDKELQALLKQKDDKYKERDLLRSELIKMQRELKKQYTIAEEMFVPIFQGLAKSFLGVDLFISTKASESVSKLGLSLVLEMRGSYRHEEYQLSESQRFFLDIALRMALARYMSIKDNEATLFIDTPEGSLDIAYEARAGLMFSKFVKENHSMLMTANINSSQILRRLAKECGKERMELHKMTEWAEMSEVQLAEESIFRDAYKKIEQALESH